MTLTPVDAGRRTRYHFRSRWVTTPWWFTLGGWLGGRLYVMTGSYDLVWWLSIALAVVAALLNVPVREVPVARLQAAAEAAT